MKEMKQRLANEIRDIDNLLPPDEYEKLLRSNIHKARQTLAKLEEDLSRKLEENKSLWKAVHNQLKTIRKDGVKFPRKETVMHTK